MEARRGLRRDTAGWIRITVVNGVIYFALLGKNIKFWSQLDRSMALDPDLAVDTDARQDWVAL